MRIAIIDFDKESQCLRFLSPEDNALTNTIGEVVLSGVIVDNVDDLTARIGRLVFGLIENATGSSPFKDYSFGKELDEPKRRRIGKLEEMANQGDADALFEIFNIYFAVGVRNFDEGAFALAESHLARAVDRGSKKAIDYARVEWPQVRAMSLEHIHNKHGRNPGH
jgi:hypothetical protein